MAKRKNGRAKGQRGERIVAKLLSEWWGADFARTPQSGGFRNKKFREDWNAEADIVTADDSFPFCVEVKWQEGWSLDHLLTSDKSPIWEWWNQCWNQCPENKIPLLVFKRNNMPWYFMGWSRDFNHLTPNKFLEVYSIEGHLTVGLFEEFLGETTPEECKDEHERKERQREEAS